MTGWLCVPIRAGFTVKGTQFTPEALERAVPLFEGAPVFRGHPPLVRPRRRGLTRKGADVLRPGTRRFPGPVGTITAPSYRGGSIVATLTPVGDYLPSLIEAGGALPGLSIAGRFAWPDGQRGVFGAPVAIERVVSVDLVERAAAGGFFPLAEGRPIPADQADTARLIESALSTTHREVWLP